MSHDFDLSQLAFLKGRNLHLSVDLAFILRHTSVGLDGIAGFSETMLEALRDLLGDTSSVMISAFNYDFGETLSFNPRTSPSHVGRFSSLMLRHPEAIRTAIPFYSFVVFGPHQERLVPYPYRRSTGVMSPFSFQVEENYLLLSIGHHSSKALTIIHHAEDLGMAEWRKNVWRDGRVTGGDGTVQRMRVQFLARKAGIKFSGLTVFGDRLMRKKEIILQSHIRVDGVSVPCDLVELSPLTGELVASLLAGAADLVSPDPPQRENTLLLSSGVADDLFLERVKIAGSS